jgi:hypothetical protein
LRGCRCILFEFGRPGKKRRQRQVTGAGAGKQIGHSSLVNSNLSFQFEQDTGFDMTNIQ